MKLFLSKDVFCVRTTVFARAAAAAAAAGLNGKRGGGKLPVCGCDFP